MTYILEAIEIKRIWPKYNRSLKKFEHAYGLFAYEDQRGLLRLAINKHNKFTDAVYTFNSLSEGYSLLRRLCQEYQLCPKLCFLQKSTLACNDLHCRGVCRGEESIDSYNSRVLDALNRFKCQMPNFALTDEGRFDDEKSWILIEKGNFYGMGYLSNSAGINNIEELKPHLTPYLTNDYIKNLIHSYASRFPDKKFRSVIKAP